MFEKFQKILMNFCQTKLEASFNLAASLKVILLWHKFHFKNR